MSGLLTLLLRLANRVKSAWEWYVIAAWLFGLPSVGVIAAFVAGEPLDMIIMYVMAGLAFLSVMFIEVMPSVTSFIERRRSSKFRISLNVNGDCCSALDAPGFRWVGFGVENRTGNTIVGAKPYLQIVGAATRALLWSGEEEEKAIDIDPTPEGFHRHASLAIKDEQGCRLLLAYAPKISLLPDTPCEVLLFVTGGDIQPARARARLTFEPPDDISVELLPADGVTAC